LAKPIALICSVDLELKPLLADLDGARSEGIGSLRMWYGAIGGRDVIAVAGGMGKTNAAHALTTLISSNSVRAVIGFGVGGGYFGSGLQTGDIAVAESEAYGDEGVATPTGWISTSGIGIPLLSAADRTLFNEFPAHSRLVDEAVRALGEGATKVVQGPFVTVSCCSGTRARGDELAARFGAICETMEGAAYAHVAALHNLPYLELRGISNLVEDRDLSRWRLEEAAANCAAGLVAVLEAWPEHLVTGPGAPETTVNR
jgi:futalosine hydrolase